MEDIRIIKNKLESKIRILENKIARNIEEIENYERRNERLNEEIQFMKDVLKLIQNKK